MMIPTIYYLAAGLFLLANLITFILFGLDKRKARKGRWRVPELTLLLWCFFGGALGGWLGMSTFRHKTQHWKFRILVPLFLLLQVLAAVYLCYITI